MRKQIEIKRTENEQLKIIINKEVQANKALLEEKGNLVQEVNACKTTVRTLDHEVEKLEQELEKMKAGKQTLNALILSYLIY